MIFNQLLVTLGWLVLLLSPFVSAEYVPTIFIGSFPPKNNQVNQYETYNITWGGANLSSVDVYLNQQTKKDVLANFDPSRDTPLAANVTESPFKWNVTQPVGTYWTLTFTTNASLGTAMGTPNLQVVGGISAAAGKVSTSLALILPAALIVAIGGYC